MFLSHRTRCRASGGLLIVLAVPDAPLRLRMRAGLTMLAVHAKPRILGDLLFGRTARHRRLGRRHHPLAAGPLDGGRRAVKQLTEQRRSPSGPVEAGWSVIARRAKTKVASDGWHGADLLRVLGYRRGTVQAGVRPRRQVIHPHTTVIGNRRASPAIRLGEPFTRGPRHGPVMS